MIVVMSGIEVRCTSCSADGSFIESVNQDTSWLNSTQITFKKGDRRGAEDNEVVAAHYTGSTKSAYKTRL